MPINSSTNYQNVPDCPVAPDSSAERIWMAGLMHMFVLLVVVFFAEINAAKADGLFDFQMTLAEKGNAEAQYKVGEMYETGFGVKQNQSEAEKWIIKAATQGHETAGFKLLFWDMQKNGLKGDNKTKYNELMKKAEAGDGMAMYYAGKIYANGAGVPKSHDKALDWFNKAIFIGVIEAEREAIVVREEKQREHVQERRAEEQRRVKQQAKLEEQKRKQDEEKRKEEETKRVEAESAKKAQSSNEESQRRAEREAELARKKKAEEQAAAQAAAQTAEDEKEKKRQALLKQRAEAEEDRKSKFDSDPCTGKSARFLSTCR